MEVTYYFSTGKIQAQNRFDVWVVRQVMHRKIWWRNLSETDQFKTED
jgi:hypothetical protein